MIYQLMVFLFLVFISICLLIWLILHIKRSERNEAKTQTEASIKTALIQSSRVNCGAENVFCFEDQDCKNMCLLTEQNVCRNGICRNRRVIATNPNNECDPTKGLFALFVGDPALGRYEWVCDTIDPGVALPDGNNRMCEGGTMEINYLREFPSIPQCTCPVSDRVAIGATSSTRRIVQCNNVFASLLRRVLPRNSTIE